jgi:hypothetical protein
MSCSNCCPVTRNYIGQTFFELRPRTDFGRCDHGVHGAVRAFEFDSTFHGVCGNWINYVHRNTPSDFYVDWVGTGGVMACGNKDASSLHRKGRAFDVTYIYFNRPYPPSTHYIDMNTDWKTTGCTPSQYRRRQYVGLAAAARYYVSTVIIAWFRSDPTHRNHIHFDNGVAYSPLRRSWETDANLVQAAGNYLNGERLVLDGVWGDKTEAAYKRLLAVLRMTSYSPTSNKSHARLFVHLIAQAALKGQPAGYYTA